MEKKSSKLKRGEKKETKAIKPVVRTSRKRAKKAKATESQIIGLFNLKVPRGAHKKKRILGRGPSSGHGKTSTRGSKGQTSRAGRHFYLGFEGGQSPLIRRMPKRGFTSRSKKVYQIVNLRDLARIKELNITAELMQQKGLIKDKENPIKVLGSGEIKAPITVAAHAFSKSAAAAIKNSGGKTELINV